MEKINFIQLKFPQIAVVEASAGSGKTYALAKRFLQLLINKTDPTAGSLNQILAITFTNKAAYQMKERILEILKNIALDSFESPDYKEDILNALGVDYSFARQKSRFIIEEIIRCYSFFQVRTIDSFINSLLSGCALCIRRSARFKVKRNYKEYLLYALDYLIEMSLSDLKLKKELDGFLRHYLFVENRAGWFPKNQILELVVSLFEMVNRYGKSFSQYKVDTELLLKKKGYIYDLIKALSDKLPEGLNKQSQKSITNFLQFQSHYFDINSLPKSFLKITPPLNKGKKADSDFFAEWQKVHYKIREAVEIEAESAYNPYINIFNKLSSLFDVFAQKEDILFLSQLNRQARFLFDKEGITVAELYYRLATRLRHYLIDEFQDTSWLQWVNLEPMIQDAISSGGTLFYVGDKKQAIYRFRGGQSQLFDKIQDKFCLYDPVTLQLTKNWRSQKEIVEFNNFIFSSQNLFRFLKSSKISRELNRKKHLDEIVNNFSASKQTYRESNKLGYVFIEKLNEKNQSQRNEVVRKKLRELIFELRKRFNLGDIALLVRDNREVELLTGWLLEEGLPPESEKTLNVLEHPQIKELLGLLRFLYSPIDDLSFASFVLGRIFQNKSGLNSGLIKDFFFNLQKKRKKKTFRFYREFAANFPQAWEELIAPFFKTAGFISAYELLVAVYRRYAISDNFPEAQAFFKKFLQLCSDSQKEWAGLWGFLSYLNDPDPENIYVNVTAENSVKILTIHKAKGLEFPVVIIPFLRMSLSAESGAKETKSYLESKGDSQLHLLRITKEQREYSPRLARIYQESFKQGCIDELNNIYVALTRPKNELYAFIPQRSGNSLNQVLFLIEEEKVEKGRKHKYPCFFSGPRIEKIGTSSYKDWFRHLSQEIIEVPLGAKREKVKEGIILHQALAAVRGYSSGNLDSALTESLQHLKSNLSLKEVDLYKEKLKKLIGHKDFRELFLQSGAVVYPEQEVVDKRGNTVRIDRMLVFKEKVVIVDYKKSRESAGEARKQLKNYKEIVSGVYPKKKIEAVIVYLDELSKEYL